MGRMLTPLTVRATTARTVGALIDSGSGLTILSNLVADHIGLDYAAEDQLDFAGAPRQVCYRYVDLHIPGTDCLVEHMRVAVIAKQADDIPTAILGADFLQRTGAFLDFRKDRHAVGGDIDGRDPDPAVFVTPRRVRLVRNRKRRRNRRR